MTQATVPTYVYTVYTRTGCTVTAPGFPSFSVECVPGAANGFTAPGMQVEISDPEATMVLVKTFNGALAALGMLGGGKNILPAGYTRLEYLEFTGPTTIRLAVPVNNLFGLYFDYEKSLPVRTNDFPISWQKENPYRGFRLVFEETNGGFGWWSAGKLAYKNTEAQRTLWRANFQNSRILSVDSADHGHAEMVLSDLDCDYDEVVFGRIFILDTKELSYGAYFKAFAIKLSSGSEVVYDLVPALDETGAPCMFDKVSRKPFYNAGTGQFVVGMTLNQVRALRLPAGGGELTLSLPQAASTDFDSQMALDRARSHGWTLIIQYREELDVPEGYKRLDFLESTGTQYIDTEYTPTQVDEFNLVFFIGASAYEAYPLMSAGDGDNQLVLVAQRDASSLENTTFLYLRYFCSVATRATINIFQKNKLLTNKDGKIFINETYVGRSLPLGEVNTSLLLFKRVSKSDFCRGRIYSFSISRAGVPQVDYVPCIAPDGKLGMYNRVDGSLKENLGSGQFIAGLATREDVRTLYLPETNGEMTVSVPADTTEEDIDIMKLNNSTWLIAVQYRTESNEN